MDDLFNELYFRHTRRCFQILKVPKNILTRELTSVTAAILAGGQGTRLRPVVADRPKVLAEVQGRPFVTYLFDQLVKAGIKSVVLCTGYMGDQIHATFGGDYGYLKILYSREPSAVGTAGSVRLALPLFTSDAVLVMNGDSYCRTDLDHFWTWHCLHHAGASVLLTYVTDTGRYGQVDVDDDGRVLGFHEKAASGKPGWINAGIYLISRRLIETIPSGHAISLEQEVLPTWIGRELYGYRINGEFIDIGTPESFALANRVFSF